MSTLPALQFELEAAEFSYVLATLGATSLWGVEPQPLFVEDQAARDALYDRGLAQLRANGWMVPAENNTWDIDPNLLWVVAIVANPQIVSITTRYVQPEGQQIAIHYLSDQSIIELTFTQAEKYRFATIPGQSALLTRVSTALVSDTDSQGFAPLTIELSTQLLEELGPSIKAKQVEQANALVQKTGMPAQQSALITTTLMQARRVAEFQLNRTLPDELLGTFEMMLLQAETGNWLMRTSDKPETMLFERVNASILAERLGSVLDELRKIESTPEKRK